MLSEGTPLSFESARQRFKWMAVARQRFYNGMCWIRPVSLGHTLDSLGVTWTNYDGLKGYTVDTTICLYIYIYTYTYIYIYISTDSLSVCGTRKVTSVSEYRLGNWLPDQARPGHTRPHQPTPGHYRPYVYIYPNPRTLALPDPKSSYPSHPRSQILRTLALPEPKSSHPSHPRTQILVP
jgi:hypothetical protein